MKKYCLALDLYEDEDLIRQYEEQHKSVWPEIQQSIRDSGIEEMEIYRLGNRLFMIMVTNDDFSFEEKAAADAASEIVQKWETMLWKFQKPLPWAKPGEKWMLMDKIFEL